MHIFMHHMSQLCWFSSQAQQERAYSIRSPRTECGDPLVGEAQTFNTPEQGPWLLTQRVLRAEDDGRACLLVGLTCSSSRGSSRTERVVEEQGGCLFRSVASGRSMSPRQAAQVPFRCKEREME